MVAGANDQNTTYLDWLHLLVFSIYLPFLIVSAHEGGNQYWANRLVFFLVSHGYLRASHAMEDYRVDATDFLLLWISAALIFAFLHLFRTFSFTKATLRTFAGFVAIAGFPLACLHQLNANALWYLVVSTLAAAGLILWGKNKWPLPFGPTLLLLAGYFGFWTLLGARMVGAWILVWPAWQHSIWGIWKVGWLIYALLGFSSTLLWASYLRRSDGAAASGNARN